MKIDSSNEQKCTLGPVRFSYMNLFHPRTNDSGQKEYTCTFLIPKEANGFCKDPQAEIDGIKACTTAAAKAGQDRLKGKDGKVSPNWTRPLKDGDEDGKYPGYWHISAKAFGEDTEGNEKIGPTIVGADNVPIPNGFVSGDWGKVMLFFHTYNVKGKQGVCAKINKVQCLYKDEPFGKGEDEFEPVEDATLVGAAAAPADLEFDPFSED